METIKGKDVSIKFDGSKCIHSRNCVLSLPEVFVGGKEGAWIFPDKAPVEDIVILAQGCPSGAIHYERHDGGEAEPKPEVNTVRTLEDGPLSVKADIVLSGKAIGNRATLCRCGQSKNKPYCDGSHNQAKFTATGQTPVQDFKALEARNGPLKITPASNGPLMVKGNLELISGTGARTNLTQKTALCRCGASANKPYCDGSHAKIGFKSD